MKRRLAGVLLFILWSWFLIPAYLSVLIWEAWDPKSDTMSESTKAMVRVVVIGIAGYHRAAIIAQRFMIKNTYDAVALRMLAL